MCHQSSKLVEACRGSRQSQHTLARGLSNYSIPRSNTRHQRARCLEIWDTRTRHRSFTMLILSNWSIKWSFIYSIPTVCAIYATRISLSQCENYRFKPQRHITSWSDDPHSFYRIVWCIDTNLELPVRFQRTFEPSVLALKDFTWTVDLGKKLAHLLGLCWVRASLLSPPLNIYPTQIRRISIPTPSWQEA